MSNRTDYKHISLNIITECCRLLVGATFIFSGFTKAIDPVGFSIKIGEYLAAFGLEMLDFLSFFGAFNLIAIEFALGVCLIMGVYRRYTTLLTMLLMAFMTLLTLYLALFDPVSDCGCFGDAVVLTNWETFGKNVVLMAASVFLFIYNQRIHSFYTYKVYWFVALFAYLFCIGFEYMNYTHLPVIDFRPYKIGVSIPELMSIPEGEEEDVYNYSFLYEKDGVRKEFSIEALPTDSAWVFIESKTELIKEGYRPEVEAFNLYSVFGEDVTDEVLYNDEGVILLICPNLAKTNDSNIDEINSVYDYTLEHNLAFYGITGSSLDDVNEWCDYTGAEYPFLMADDVLLKTIIRSNPGLVVLKNGVILGKYDYRDIPEEEDIDRTLGSLIRSNEPDFKDESWKTTNLLTFAVPLLLVWIYDLLRNRRRKRKETSTTNEEPISGVEENK